MMVLHRKNSSQPVNQNWVDLYIAMRKDFREMLVSNKSKPWNNTNAIISFISKLGTCPCTQKWVNADTTNQKVTYQTAVLLRSAVSVRGGCEGGFSQMAPHTLLYSSQECTHSWLLAQFLKMKIKVNFWEETEKESPGLFSKCRYHPGACEIRSWGKGKHSHGVKERQGIPKGTLRGGRVCANHPNWKSKSS